MKYANHKAFEKHLEGSSPHHFSNIYFILSKDPSERKVGLDTLLKILKKGKGESDLSVRSFQGENLKAQDLTRNLDTFSFFSKTEVIVVHQADEVSSDVKDAFVSFCQNPSQKHILILVASAISHNTTLYKAGEKQGIVLEIAEEKAWEKEKTLTEWVISQFQSERKSIDSNTALAMVKQVGQDRCALQQEIDKLICYVGDTAAIKIQDIQAICQVVHSENEWQLGEAIFRRDSPSTFATLHALLDDQNAFFPLIRQLRTQFQTLLQVASTLSNGGRPEDVTQIFPYMKGFILNQKVQQAQQYGQNSLKKGLLLIDEAEINAKNGMDDHHLLADLLVSKLITQV